MPEEDGDKSADAAPSGNRSSDAGAEPGEGAEQAGASKTRTDSSLSRNRARELTGLGGGSPTGFRYFFGASAKVPRQAAGAGDARCLVRSAGSGFVDIGASRWPDSRGCCRRSLDRHPFASNHTAEDTQADSGRSTDQRTGSDIGSRAARFAAGHNGEDKHDSRRSNHAQNIGAGDACRQPGTVVPSFPASISRQPGPYLSSVNASATRSACFVVRPIAIVFIELVEPKSTRKPGLVFRI